ncbi:MAG: hypothetical protein E3K32_12795 [wastewater metagenome]|nr:hypothetical protein [Candidatus Loosdrechtia aerotolerans]
MKKKHLKKITENPDFIPNIYNYCDRWCERCSFTSRCENYALSKKNFTDSESRNINNHIFWQNMAEVFELPLDILKEVAKQEGIELDILDTKTTTKKTYRDIAKNHECSRLAMIYGEMVDNWFKLAEGLFDEKEHILNIKIRLGILDADTDTAAEAAVLNDAVDIICWYQHQIYVKLMRAIQGDIEEKSEHQDRFPRDSHGSAKIALIAMDRSIAAWEKMGKLFPEQKDNILDILLHLDRLRRKTEEAFPAARAFVRPGFDTIDPNSKPLSFL